MKGLHTCQQPLTLSYCNQGKENRKRNWLQKEAHTHLCLKTSPADYKTGVSWDFIREHGTKNIDIHDLDASGQLCRICISISIGFLPLVSGNKESGTGCVFGSGSGIWSGSGNDIFENSYFDSGFDFYWTCIFLVENYCSSGYGCDVYIDSVDLFLQVLPASGDPVLVSWPIQQRYLF